jgi:hypothetical protein
VGEAFIDCVEVFDQSSTYVGNGGQGTVYWYPESGYVASEIVVSAQAKLSKKALDSEYSFCLDFKWLDRREYVLEFHKLDVHMVAIGYVYEFILLAEPDSRPDRRILRQPEFGLRQCQPATTGHCATPTTATGSVPSSGLTGQQPGSRSTTAPKTP